MVEAEAEVEAEGEAVKLPATRPTPGVVTPLLPKLSTAAVLTETTRTARTVAFRA